jgi:hypothetical protein
MFPPGIRVALFQTTEFVESVESTPWRARSLTVTARAGATAGAGRRPWNSRALGDPPETPQDNLLPPHTHAANEATTSTHPPIQLGGTPWKTPPKNSPTGFPRGLPQGLKSPPETHPVFYNYLLNIKSSSSTVVFFFSGKVRKQTYFHVPSRML